MLPWPDMLRAAARLGLSPRSFWQLSLREWRLLTGESGPALSRAGFDQLMRTYPDKES